ncbi:MAG: hypothetical protein R6V59_04355 [Dehalococcoidia bacterium]
MKKAFLILLATALALSMVLVGCPDPIDDNDVDPVTPEEFYQGRQLELYTGPAGGSLTVGSELLMQHFAEATGATVVPLYYDALGGIESFNKGYEEAPRDGSAFMGFGMETVFTNALLEEPGVRYEIDELIWLGSILGTPMALWTNPEEYADVAALQAGEDLLQAGASRLGFMAFWGTAAGYWLGLDFQTVIGVGSPAMCKTSILAGDTHFLNVPVHHPGSPPELMPVVLISDERHPYFYPDVPAITEVVDPWPQGEEDWLQMAKVAARYTAAGVAFPPDVPQDRVEYVRGVLNDIAESDAFIADWTAMMGYWDGWHTGEDVEASYILYSDNAEDFKAIYALVDTYYITL